MATRWGMPFGPIVAIVPVRPCSMKVVISSVDITIWPR